MPSPKYPKAGFGSCSISIPPESLSRTTPTPWAVAHDLSLPFLHSPLLSCECFRQGSTFSTASDLWGEPTSDPGILIHGCPKSFSSLPRNSWAARPALSKVPMVRAGSSPQPLSPRWLGLSNLPQSPKLPLDLCLGLSAPENIPALQPLISALPAARPHSLKSSSVVLYKRGILL